MLFRLGSHVSVCDHHISMTYFCNRHKAKRTWSLCRRLDKRGYDLQNSVRRVSDFAISIFCFAGRFYFQDSILPVLLSAMPLLLNLLKTRYLAALNVPLPFHQTDNLFAKEKDTGWSKKFHRRHPVPSTTSPFTPSCGSCLGRHGFHAFIMICNSCSTLALL